MHLKFTFIIRLGLFLIIILCLFIGQSTLPNNSGFSNNAYANNHYAKTGVSPYKKSFARSKRINSRKSRRRSSNSSSCVYWNASKINRKASNFKHYIDQYARQYRVDRNLIKAIITAESCFKVKALSHAGAQGLMQLIPATAKRFGVKNSFKPKQNIRGGTRYLRFLMDRFKGNLKKVIASYNAGEGAVDKYNGIPPYKETQQYVKNVMRVYTTLNPNKLKTRDQIPAKGKKAGRQGWQYNRSIAPHLFKK